MAIVTREDELMPVVLILELRNSDLSLENNPENLKKELKTYFANILKVDDKYLEYCLISIENDQSVRFYTSISKLTIDEQNKLVESLKNPLPLTIKLSTGGVLTKNVSQIKVTFGE
ncbi:hypothetical protein BU202_04555 [Streptococcus cuniculi]|uniref:Uncharacterized protein n=1 Tax=Streptococcus cuniculi TaxID=1432788 RepID=A0A1Q8E910_9STRE|nr:hypothetical protein [Streptococcus cuniculi]OLF48268.1 hypothetical protein BU202_04555 [Streptococcus cuniculi]